MVGEKTDSALNEISSTIPDATIATSKRPDWRKREGPSFRMAILSLLDSLCHALAIALVVYLFWDLLKESGTSLTAWHISLFALAYVFFLTEGLLTFLPHSVLTRGWGHKHLVKLHWILQLFGFIFIVVGMIIAIVFKAQANRPHFTSSHAITGLVAVILAVLVSLGGWWTRLDRKFHLGLKLSYLKLAHTALGVVAYGVGMATQIMGYFTPFYARKHDYEWRVFLAVMTGLLTSVAFLFATASLYRRTKELLRY